MSLKSLTGWRLLPAPPLQGKFSEDGKMSVEIDSIYWTARIDTAKLKKDIAEATKLLGDSHLKGDKEFEKLSSTSTSIFNKIAAPATVYFSLQTITKFIGAIASVRGEFQKYEAVLTNTRGSGSRAQDAMSMIQNFAAKTPFPVTELTNSFV